MANKYMARDDAPFDENVWKMLDDAVIGAAKSQLTGRKLLDIEGPYGLGLKSVPLGDQVTSEGEVQLITSRTLNVSLIETSFTLGERDLASYEDSGFPIDLEPVGRAAMAMAAMEDSMVFEGNKQAGVEGLLNTPGSQSMKLASWNEVGAAADDIIKAVTILDDADFHGPYTLALAPGLYNLLFRRYQQGNQLEMDHVKAIVGGSVVKAPAVKKGGVLLASGKQFASLVIGQDMTTGFVGPDGPDYEFKITESLAPRVRVPAAVCVLKA